MRQSKKKNETLRLTITYQTLEDLIKCHLHACSLVDDDREIVFINIIPQGKDGQVDLEVHTI
jgi:hypothetical protein